MAYIHRIHREKMRNCFLWAVGLASLSMIPTCPEASSDSGLASMSPKAGGKTRLLLVRHGERIDVADKDWFKGTDSPWDPWLSDLGQAQAYKLGLHLNKRGGVDRILSSPFLRCIQFAHRVSDCIDTLYHIYPEPGVCQWLHTAFFPEHETHQTKSGQQLLWNSPKYLKVQCDSVDDSYPALLEPNFGETAGAFRARCKEAISRICKEHKGETVLVVTHAAVIEAAIQALLPGTVVPEVRDGAMTELREIGEGVEDGEGQVGGWGIVGNVCEVGYLGENYGKLEHILNEEDG